LIPKRSHITATEWFHLLLIALTLPLLKAWLTAASGLEMHFDEAQYWSWTKALDWSYATKGPLLTWLIFLSESLFGHGEWQARLPGWIAASLFLIILHAFARDLWDSRSAGWWALLLGLLTPVYGLLGMVMTTDIFLFLFWSWGLWAAYRALIRDRRLAWYELGLAAGIGVLTKLSIGLLPAAVGLFVLIHPNYRRHLRDPHVWGGIGLLLLCAAPVIYWNWLHGWVMFRHNVGHVSHETWSLLRVGEFLLGQWVMLSPLVVLAALPAVRRPVDAGGRFIWTVSLGCLLFFLIKAASAEILLNWAGPVYIGFLVLFAGHIDRLSRWLRGLFYAGLTLSLVMLALVMSPASFSLPEANWGLKKLRAWREPVAQLAQLAGPVDYIMAPEYRLASELHFYWPEPVNVYVLGASHLRFTQYDIWPGLDQEQGANGLYISNYAGRPAYLERSFERCDPLPPVEARARDGAVARVFHAFRCQGYKPGTQPRPGKY
jgi:undecaprenyl-diphosphatase